VLPRPLQLPGGLVHLSQQRIGVQLGSLVVQRLQR
jgi:hypothetical protein